MGCGPRRSPRHPELADIVRAAGTSYGAARRLTGEQRVALAAILRCRTPELGGHVEVCDACGHRRTVYRSCGNRHCPKCSTLAKERWLAARHAELLPVDYAHVVFTLPHALNGFARYRPRLVYDTLFQAASATLLEFARDPRHLGADPAIVAILHTWSQTLQRHIHLHCIVTAGGLDPTGRRWRKTRRGYLFPVRALSRVFRGRYLARLYAGAAATLTPSELASLRALEPRLREHDWVVYAKAPPAGPHRVLDYLARYTHRVALTNDRILGFDGATVRLRWRDSAHRNRRRVLALDRDSFLDRFLLHVLPHGFKRIRHYGLLAPGRKRRRLDQCRRYFGLTIPSPSSNAQTVTVASLFARLDRNVTRCTACGAAPLRREFLFPPETACRLRAPP
jgi:Putative transposase/Transposase zinc-binding domain